MKKIVHKTNLRHNMAVEARITTIHAVGIHVGPASFVSK